MAGYNYAAAHDNDRHSQKMTVNRGRVAKVRITPTLCPIVETFTLRQVGVDWVVSIVSRDKWEGSVVRTSRKLDANCVDHQIAQLQSAKIPVVFKGEMSCDGWLVEVTIYSDTGTLSASWWTELPDGAETLGRFVEWLRGVCE